jgi:hypothetical protein
LKKLYSSNAERQADRVYSTRKETGKKLVLVTWIQRRCVACQRFLSKHQIKYCDRCKPKENLRVKRIGSLTSYHKTHSNAKYLPQNGNRGKE